MVVTVAAHEVDAGRTGRDAVDHQLDMRLFDMVAAFRKAVAGQRVGTGRLTFLAFLQAFLHDCGCGTHSFLLWKWLVRPRCRRLFGMQLAYHNGV